MGSCKWHVCYVGTYWTKLLPSDSHQLFIGSSKKIPHVSVQTLVRIKGSFLHITAVSMNFSWWIFKIQKQKCLWKHEVLLKLLLIISAKPSQRLYVFPGLFPVLLSLWSPIELNPFSQGSVQVNVWYKILNLPLVTNCPLYLQSYRTILGGSQKCVKKCQNTFSLKCASAGSTTGSLFIQPWEEERQSGWIYWSCHNKISLYVKTSLA